MSDGVQMEINVGGVRLAIAVRVLGGEVVSVREQQSRPAGPPDGQGAPAAPAAGPRAYGTTSHGQGGGRGPYPESIIPAINAARERFGLADGRGAGAIAAFLGVERFTVKAAEAWLQGAPGRTIDGLMNAVVSARGERR